VILRLLSVGASSHRAALAMALAAMTMMFLPPPAEAQQLWTDGELDEGDLEEPFRFGTFRELATLRSPAVVNIRVRIRGGVRDQYVPGVGDARAEGSGFIVNEDGLCVTNNHVVEDAVEISVLLSDGRALPAELVGSDPRTDIALIRITSEEPLPFVPLGDSAQVMPGDWVLAIGNPLGLEHSVTAGIVSALGRRDIRPDGRELYSNFIQIDAPINPGNSGGPLLDIMGNVIGMNTVVNVRANNIGFAVPVNMVKALLPQLAQGQVERSWLGARGTRATVELATEGGQPFRPGALIEEVVPGSPADEGGLRAGDIVVSFDDVRILDYRELAWLASIAGIDRTVEIEVLRDGRERTLEVEMARLPGASASGNLGDGGGVAMWRSRFVDVSSEIASELNVPDGVGVAVRDVEAGPALRAGLQIGDVVIQVGDTVVNGTAALLAEAAEQEAGAAVQLRVRRGAAIVFVVFIPAAT
jgi:serine protease Do